MVECMSYNTHDKQAGVKVVKNHFFIHYSNLQLIEKLTSFTYREKHIQRHRGNCTQLNIYRNQIKGYGRCKVYTYTNKTEESVGSTPIDQLIYKAQFFIEVIGDMVEQ